MDSLVAGAAAGLFVDLSLYPIDTIKTRLQSKEWLLRGRWVFKNLQRPQCGGGWIYPRRSRFFAYDSVKRALLSLNNVTITNNATTEMSLSIFASQMVAAACGESTACFIRVPVEMVKQQMQAGHHRYSALQHITNNVAPGAAGDSVLRIRLTGVPYLQRDCHHAPA
ncbi:S-adenosylmethionine mitochondrial carrier protein-like [Bactrocera neohumeralis]|uniref:S-adenosylmethionine mitochondrial carrier protein-like n=1 Tax=Bactrocera neohumeralis TaxID=98809 RepID=UPI002166A76C|nr:S-adenosylmethionine mitochondrial carrier protein-like [Bactrocera neohumeralis]